MVFLRIKKSAKKSRDVSLQKKSSVGVGHTTISRTTSGLTSADTDTSSEVSNDQNELFLDSGSSVRTSPLLRGSALEDSTVVCVASTASTATTTVEGLENVINHELDQSKAFDGNEDEDFAMAASEDEEVQFTEKDIYSQRHPIENPKLISKRLVAFDAAVNKLPQRRRINLNEAIENCPELLTDGFKLKFLRCECFNVKRAANRYVKYWDRRVQVFGKEKAFLPLTLDGALKDDEVALSVGFLTLVRNKDSSGRNIVFGDPVKQQFDKYTTESMIRAVWYIFHAALDDEETQKRGLVFLADLSAASLSLVDHELIKVVALSVTGCIPVRLSGIHGCFPPSVFWVIFPLLKILLGERLRKRIKIHSGSKQSVHANLIKYGMGADTHPTEIGGALTLDNTAWLEDRRSQQL